MGLSPKCGGANTQQSRVRAVIKTIFSGFPNGINVKAVTIQPQKGAENSQKGSGRIPSTKKERAAGLP